MPRAKKPDIEPGTVPLDDEPVKAAAPKGRPPKKGAKQKKEAEPTRSHHAKPGPNADQVKGGLAFIGGLVQNGLAIITVDKDTGHSPVERIALDEEELGRAANVIGDKLVRITPVAAALSAFGAASKASPIAKELTALAAPRLARLGLIPPAVAKMLGVSAEDIQAGINYRAERIARDKAARTAPRGVVTREPMLDPRDRVPTREPIVEASATVDDRPLPSVGVPPEAYRARGTEVEPMPSPSPRGAAGADSLSGT